MFKFQPGFQYTMPAHFGIGHSPRSSLLYLDVTTISIGYRTDREKLERYLPEPFALRGDPTLVVYYAMNKEVEPRDLASRVEGARARPGMGGARWSGIRPPGRRTRPSTTS
jgi:hypothetical protein